VVEGV